MIKKLTKLSTILLFATLLLFNCSKDEKKENPTGPSSESVSEVKTYKIKLKLTIDTSARPNPSTAVRLYDNNGDKIWGDTTYTGAIVETPYVTITVHTESEMYKYKWSATIEFDGGVSPRSWYVEGDITTVTL